MAAILRKGILVVGLIIITLVDSSFKETESNFIFWSPSRKIAWNDFQCPLNDSIKKNEYQAATFSDIKYKLSYDDTGKFNFIVICRFDKSKSWVKSYDSSLLAHEQCHFDITEIHARILRERLAEYRKRYNYETVEKDIQQIFQYTAALEVFENATYDFETNHSRNTDKQLSWEKKIKKQLDSLSSYQDSLYKEWW